MAILVYTESEQGKFKKIAFELASYARSIADENNTTVTAVCINAESPMELQNYGVNKVLNISNQDLKSFNAMSYSQCVFEAAENENSNIIVISSSADSKYLAPLLAVKHNSGYISNACELPTSYSPLTVKRTAFTNKAFEIKCYDQKVPFHIFYLHFFFGARANGKLQSVHIRYCFLCILSCVHHCGNTKRNYGSLVWWKI